MRNWSFDTLEREVSLNLACREFARMEPGKVPDAKTLARIAQAVGGDAIERLHERLVKMAQERGVIQGRRMRVDTTVVETNIHYPTDSKLLARREIAGARLSVCCSAQRIATSRARLTTADFPRRLHFARIRVEQHKFVCGGALKIELSGTLPAMASKGWSPNCLPGRRFRRKRTNPVGRIRCLRTLACVLNRFRGSEARGYSQYSSHAFPIETRTNICYYRRKFGIGAATWTPVTEVLRLPFPFAC